MIWTHEKPTQPGWYWIRTCMDDGACLHKQIVEIAGGSTALFVNAPYEDWDGEEVGEFIGSEFAGPIEEPKEQP